MDRMRTHLVLASFLLFLACEPDLAAPPVEPQTSEVSGLVVTGETVGDFGPFPIVYPFMPFPDGYRFSNFGGTGDWMLFSDIFGGSVSFWSILDRDYYTNSFLPGFGGGQCYGFAITAGMFYRNTVHPSHFQERAHYAFDVNRDTGSELDEDIELHIEKHWFMWNGRETHAQRVFAETQAEAEEILDLVEAEFQTGWNDPWVLSFWSSGGGGHTVNILNLARTEGGGIFTVWDNNAPFNNETNNPGWREFHFGPDGFTYGSRDIVSVAIERISPNELDHIEKWWGDLSREEFWEWVSRPIDPDMFVVHIDNLERRLGHTAGAVFDEIPDAFRVRRPGGLLDPDPDWLEPVEYRLPPGEYTVELMNPSTGQLDYRLLAGDALFSLAATGSGPAAARITSLQEARAFALEPQDPLEGVEIQVAVALSGEEERALDVSGLSLPANRSLIWEPTEGAAGFRLSLGGMDAASVNLRLTEASPLGPLTQEPGVIQDPDAVAVGAHDQVLLPGVEDEVVVGGGRQVW